MGGQTNVRSLKMFLTENKKVIHSSCNLKAVWDLLYCLIVQLMTDV